MTKLLSVIIPTVLRSSLQRAISSTDYPDVITIVQEAEEPADVLAKHVSVTQLRNQGAAMATTEWVTFLDDDDYWLPMHWDTLRLYLSQLSDTVQMVLTFPVDFPKFRSLLQLRRYILYGEGLPASCITVRKDAMTLLNGFPSDIAHSSHWALVAKALLTLGPDAVAINPEHTWTYTRNGQGLAAQLATYSNIDVLQDRRLWLNQFVS